MFGKIDNAVIKDVLGFDNWVEEEDSLDVTYLMDKSIREGLTMEEQMQYECLIALYESGL
jgi:uncharacterized protein (UPF0216 family)